MRGVATTDFPYIPGGEAAGVVDEVGGGARAAVGDAVFGLGAAAYAQCVVLDHYAPKPSGFDWPRAGGTALAAETALRCLRLVGVERGHTVVVDGASGSVGSAAVQFAVDAGADVIGTCGSSNADFVRSLGARPIAYGPGLERRVGELADRVDAGIDTTGHGSVAQLLNLTGSKDRVVTIADFSGEHDVHVTSVPSAFDALDRAAALAAEGRYTVRVGRTFRLAEAAEAHRLAEAGGSGGKIVLTNDQ